MIRSLKGVIIGCDTPTFVNRSKHSKIWQSPRALALGWGQDVADAIVAREKLLKHPCYHVDGWLPSLGSVEEVKQFLLNQQSNSVPKAIREYDDAMWEKVGPQGGVPSREAISDALDAYYQSPQRSLDIPLDMLIARDAWVAAVDTIPSRLLDEFDDVVPRDSASGIPFMGHKDNEFECCVAHQIAANSSKPLPPLVGWRQQRNATRAIFIAPWSNVLKLQRAFTLLQNQLRSRFPEFGSWARPDLSVTPQITRAIRRGWVFFGGDFKKKDQNMTLAEVQILVYPILEKAWGVHAKRLLSFIDDLYQVPTYLGQELHVGPHNAFSGETFVPPVETILGVIYGTALASKFQMHPYLNLALGDDSLLGWKGTVEQAELVRATFVEWATRCGEVAHPEKQEVSHYPRYLRRTYLNRGPVDEKGNLIGAYPVSLTVNSIWNPEYPQESIAHRVIAILQVLDNLRGHPLWNALVAYVGRRLTNVDLGGVLHTPPPVDWWSRLYGEKWDPVKSPSLTTILSK